MSTSILTPARAAYYDRNATSQVNAYAGSAIAPHAATTRWTVTVASGKKLLAEVTTCIMVRETAAATPDQYKSTVEITSGATTMVVVPNYSYSNTVSAITTLSSPAAMTLYASETIYGQTRDVSIGGTIYYAINLKGTMYDA